MTIQRTPIIDDDGTGTTGTLIDHAWKEELYDQIDVAVGSYQNVKSYGAVGNGVADDRAAIQAAIAAAAVAGGSKRVFLPPGVYGIGAPLLLPTTVGSEGVTIEGAAGDTQYDFQATASATTIKALAAMDCLISQRNLSALETATRFNRLKNLTLDGQALANYGYRNGFHDIVADVTITGCLLAGIWGGPFTNSSSFTNVTCIANYAAGVVLTGDWATVTWWYNCKFRGNTKGFVIQCAIAAHWINCIFENNIQEGLYLNRQATTPQQQAYNLRFSKCYFERNHAVGGYQIVLTGAAAGCYPLNVWFDNPHIVSGEPGRLGVQILKGQWIYFDDPIFTGDLLLTPGWFNVVAGADVANIEFRGVTDGTLGAMTLDGTGAAAVVTTGAKLTGATLGLYALGGAFKTNHLKGQQINVTTSRTLAPLEMCGSVLTNFGQGATSVTVTLPNASEGFEFTALVLTAQAGNYWRFACGSSLYLNGALVSTIANSPAVAGSAIRFTAAIGSVYYYLAEVISGTWTGA